MGKKHHRSKASPVPVSSVQVLPPSRQVGVVADTNGGVFYLPGGGYQAAGSSPNRGYLYWPTTDTRRQLNSLTRNEILRRIQWLTAHFGFCRRLTSGMARLLGFLTVQPVTSDEAWNEEAYESLLTIMGQAEIWDIQGKFDAFMGQVQDHISIFRDGDCLAVLTETETGRARLAYYEAHQIKNGPDSSGPGWTDGVRVNRQGKHVAYSLQDGEDPTQFTIVDARNCIYMGNFENRGQVRALSILAPAVLNMIDVVETRGFTKSALKNSARMGTVVERDYNAPPSSNVGGMGGTEYVTTVKMPDGSEQPVKMEAVYGGTMIPTLPPGAKVKVVTDDRPSQNSQDFERALLTDCCYAADLSYNTLCDVSNITGPGIRFLNAELKRWVLLRRHTMAKRFGRMAIYALAKEMKSGRLRKPKLKPGENWWTRLEMIGQADMDIDGGRTAAATVTDLQTGQTTLLREWAGKGVFWRRAVAQAVHEVIVMHQECRKQSEAAGLQVGLVTPERVFPLRFGITSAQPATQTLTEVPKDEADAPNQPAPEEP